jgi:hypothetical protein
MIPGHGRIEAVNFGRNGYAMHPFEAIEIGDDLPLRGVEDHELVGVHVRYIEPSARWIEGPVVESHCRTRHGNIHDLRQCLFSLRGRLSVSKGG